MRKRIQTNKTEYVYTHTSYILAYICMFVWRSMEEPGRGW